MACNKTGLPQYTMRAELHRAKTRLSTRGNSLPFAAQLLVSVVDTPDHQDKLLV